MGKFLAVALGGATGSLARYTIAIAVEKFSSCNFPLATLFVNLAGSFCIGFFWYYFDKTHITNEFRLFLFTGFLGGFTTFSTFTRESTQFFKAGETLHGLLYLVTSNTFGILMVLFGFWLAQQVTHA